MPSSHQSRGRCPSRRDGSGRIEAMGEVGPDAKVLEQSVAHFSTAEFKATERFVENLRPDKNARKTVYMQRRIYSQSVTGVGVALAADPIAATPCVSPGVNRPTGMRHVPLAAWGGSIKQAVVRGKRAGGGMEDPIPARGPLTGPLSSPVFSVFGLSGWGL